MRSSCPWSAFTAPSACRTVFFFSSRRRHTRCLSDWSSDVCSSDLGTATVASRRIFPFYTGVTRLVPMGNLSYNALIWKMEKRFTRGFTFLSAFTWAHAIDNLLEPLNNTNDQGPVVSYNRQLNRANSNSDIRRSYAFSSAYELPFGRGKALMNRGGVRNAVFGGWQVSGILTLRSGIPFTVTTSGGIT